MSFLVNSITKMINLLVHVHYHKHTPTYTQITLNVEHFCAQSVTHISRMDKLVHFSNVAFSYV